MQYPLLLAAGALASATGMGMNMAANAQAQDAMNRVRRAAAAKQKEFQSRAESVFKKSLDQSGADTARADQESGEAARTEGYRALAESGKPLGTSTNLTPSARARAKAWQNIVTTAQAKLGSYGDARTAAALRAGQAGDELGVISNQARGQASILPAQMEAASHAGDSLKGWGQFASAVGSPMMMAGAMGMGPSLSSFLGMGGKTAASTVPASFAMHSPMAAYPQAVAASSRPWLAANPWATLSF